MPVMVRDLSQGGNRQLAREEICRQTEIFLWFTMKLNRDLGNNTYTSPLA
jgi:hypothetical protein